ncbi:MAG: hypothetical protein AAGD07_24130 [Planctomycetota bacterium]
MTTKIDTGVRRHDAPQQKRRTRLAVGLLMLLSCVVVVVGYAAVLHAMLGDERRAARHLDITVIRAESSDAERRDAENAATRQRAREFDRELLRERELRKYFRDQGAPGARDAARHWKQRTRNIESEIEAAWNALPEGEEVNPGSILWHRKQDLERLKEDAPRS